MALTKNGRQIADNSANAHDEQQTADSSLSSRRIVLLGKTGYGKSAAGNTILGQKEFKFDLSSTSVTTECSDAHSTVSDRSVSVVDTPGFFDTQMKLEELAEEIARSVYISSPGPHAFLIVFPVNMRFTEQEQQIPQMIEKMFGKGVLNYSIILFTHGDQLKGKSVEKLIEENCRLRDLVDQCGGRFHVFNNEDENYREQVNDLLQKIDTMIEQNGGGHYSNQMYEDAQRFRQEEEERRSREEAERKFQEKQRHKETCGEDDGFKAFLNKNKPYIMGAVVATLFVAPVAGVFAAGAVGAVGAAGAVGALGAAVTKGLVVGAAVGGATVGAIAGAAVEAATKGPDAGADVTQKKLKYNSRKKQQ